MALLGSTSPPCSVTSGVPQGSILGPLLFILTFDGIFCLPLSASSNLTGYTSDVTYSRPISSASNDLTVANDLDLICYWLMDRGFKLNHSKVKVMVVSRKRSPPHPVILLHGQPAEHVKKFKLLGVMITSDMPWGTRIDSVTAKAKKLLGFLYKTFKEAGPTCLAKLYKSIVLHHLDYCSPVRDPYHMSHSERLEKVQSFSARVIYSNWSRNASVSAMKSSLQLQSLASRRLCNKLSCHRILAWRILNGASLSSALSSRMHHAGVHPTRTSCPCIALTSGLYTIGTLSSGQSLE